ncbi:MAG: XdhC family protein [Beijerinckiaceae bacterium]|nr:XdhC family protein [Beijerinckiaceae bacterium]
MSAEDLPLIQEALAWRQAGRAAAMAIVIETSGSAPRRPGSRLAVDSEGNFSGSVSGGCVEAEVITEALEAMRSGRPRLLEFGVEDETAWRAGLSCDGQVKVYVEPIGDDQALILEVLLREYAARRACVLVTNTGSGEQRLVQAEDIAKDPLQDLIEKQMQKGQSALVAYEERQLFIDVHVPPVRLAVTGATHAAQALAAAAQLAAIEVTVIDPRSAFAAPERFPNASIVAEWPETVLPKLGLDEYTAVALLAHEPRIDDPALGAALRANCFYIGALGSKKTHAKRLERMRALGFSEAELARIHSPIGLAIGAANPAEIGIAVAAEIIAVFRQAGGPKAKAA